MSNTIKSELRHELLDELQVLGFITGGQEVSEFVQRVFPEVRSMSSRDARFKTAIQDIWQHMDNNYDWSFNYLFYTYLNLPEISDEQFLHFLEQYVYPTLHRQCRDEDGMPVDLQETCVEIINKYLVNAGYNLVVSNTVGGKNIYKAEALRKGVLGNAKNIIFAAKQKPELVFDDAINNNIRIARNENHCLIYTDTIPQTGITWQMLILWYQKLTFDDNCESRLIERLKQSMDSTPESMLFDAYIEVAHECDNNVPALMPQVYLYYDPLTQKERGWRIFEHQKMDFLMLISMSNRVVIEIDGAQHYASDDYFPNTTTRKAMPCRYAEMVKAQREMSLYGYDVYRFGGYEFHPNADMDALKSFFRRLFQKYGVYNKT